MGLYIPGLKMPNECSKCFLSYIDEKDNVLKCILGTIISKEWLIPEDCTIQEIDTPHGDLIDKNTLEKDTEWNESECGYISYSQSEINSAAVIIEEEYK